MFAVVLLQWCGQPPYVRHGCCNVIVENYVYNMVFVPSKIECRKNRTGIPAQLAPALQVG